MDLNAFDEKEASASKQQVAIGFVTLLKVLFDKGAMQPGVGRQFRDTAGRFLEYLNDDEIDFLISGTRSQCGMRGMAEAEFSDVIEISDEIAEMFTGYSRSYPPRLRDRNRPDPFGGSEADPGLVRAVAPPDDNVVHLRFHEHPATAESNGQIDD